MGESVQNINPSILRWARERKHYSPYKAAKKFPSNLVTGDVLTDWEEGVKFPTYPQLEKLADLYKVPIAVFFFPKPPAIEDAAVSLRSVPGFNLDLISHETLNVIHQVQATQMALKEFNDGVNPVSSPIHKMLKLGSHSIEIEILAKQIRGENFLNITLEKQLSWNNYMQALWAWRDAIEANGIFVFRWPFKSESLSGFCLYDEEFPVICLDSQEPKSRQIFTLLHEFAHLLHGENSVTLGEDGLEVTEENIRESERYFDNIAGSVLVPTDDLRRKLSTGAIDTEDFYIQQAKHYKVSPLMILVRSRLTNLISYDVFMNAKESFKTQRDYERGDGTNEGGGDYYLNHLSYWGKGFLQNILHKHQQKKISEYEMSQILNMKIKNIEKLEGYLINKQFGSV